MQQQASSSSSVKSAWTSHDHWLFLVALVSVPENTAERWQKIAMEIPGKSPEEVIAHYEALRYASPTNDQVIPAHPVVAGEDQSVVGSESRSKRMGKGRKRGTPWTVEEHKKFVEGLEKYGRGDWRSISRNLVPSKTPAQVASHAQKYFIRQESNKNHQEKARKRRSSIHDITTATIAAATTVADATTTVAPAQPPSPPAIASTNVSPANFHGGQESGAETSFSSFNDGLGEIQFYEGQSQVLTPMPVNWYGGEPVNWYGGGPIEFNIYSGSEGASPQMGYDQYFNFDSYY